jgi:hypothetical protein
MPKNKRKTKVRQIPKVTKVSQAQMDNFLAEIMAANLSEESAEFAKMLIHGNAWITRELERGKLTIARLRKLFQIQGSEKASNRKPNNDPASSTAKSNGGKKSDKKGHGRNSADAYQRGSHC